MVKSLDYMASPAKLTLMTPAHATLNSNDNIALNSVGHYAYVVLTLGVTKASFVSFSIKEISTYTKVYVGLIESHSYLAAKLW